MPNGLSDYQWLRNDGVLKTTIKAAMQIRKKRNKNTPIPRDGGYSMAPRCNDLMTRKHFSVLELGPELFQWAEDEARKLFPRRKNWELTKAVCVRDTNSSKWIIDADRTPFEHFRIFEEYDYPYSGSYKKYPKISYRPSIISYAAATSKKLYARVMNCTYTLTPPKGYHFGQDTLGVYVQKNTFTNERYRLHLDTDLVTRPAHKRRMAQAHAAHVTQLRARLKQHDLDKKLEKSAVRLVEKGGYFVTAHDSYRAGNCRAGTVTWGQKHNLSERKHYNFKIISKLSKTHGSIKRVLVEAAKRTVREAQVGVCMLDGSLPKEFRNTFKRAS